MTSYKALKIIFNSLFFIILSTPAFADEGIDGFLATAIKPLSDAVFNTVFYTVSVGDYTFPLILAWLVAASVFFTFYLGFINLRGLRHAFHLIRGDYDEPDAPGKITHFQALTTELSGTVGLGNIAGVAIAVSLGGPGATLWMILCGFFGMSAKFAECALGVKYRYEDVQGHVHGGPMYYLRDGLKDRGFPVLGKIMGAIFAIACVGGTIGAAGVFQANQSYEQLLNVTGGDASFFAERGWLFGLVLALLVGAVIIGGIKSIAAVASRIVPLMTIIYITAGIVVVAVNINQVPEAISIIFSSALSSEAGFGGLIGAIIAGVQRAAFSNEAGMGSASIAHSAVKTKHPMTEGFVAMTGPIFDTIIVCTLTAIVIVVSGVYKAHDGITGVQLTSEAFETVISWFPYVLTVAVILFAFSTIISWSYYGSKSINYLFGESEKAELIFKIVVCVFLIFGTTMNLSSAINLSDALIFVMSIPNIIGLYILAPELKKELKKYQVRIKGKNFSRKPEPVRNS